MTLPKTFVPDPATIKGPDLRALAEPEPPKRRLRFKGKDAKRACDKVEARKYDETLDHKDYKRCQQLKLRATTRGTNGQRGMFLTEQAMAELGKAGLAKLTDHVVGDMMADLEQSLKQG